jgi:hypothetical protein
MNSKERFQTVSSQSDFSGKIIVFPDCWTIMLNCKTGNLFLLFGTILAISEVRRGRVVGECNGA